MFSRRACARCAAAALVLVVVPGRTAAAETPYSWDAYAGYTAMRDTTDHLTFKHGWSLGTSVFINRWLSLAVDLDRQTARTPTFDGGAFTFASQAFLGGFRASGRLGVFTEFGQVLIGRVNSTGSVFGATDTTHHIAIQPGLGLDFALRARWSVRGEVDARFLDSGREARLVAALAYRIR